MDVPPSLQTALEQAVAHGVFPGAVLGVRHEDRLCIASAGRLSIEPPGGPVSSSTVYDLASLTKPLATVTLWAFLVQENRCRLDDRVEDLLPELRQAPVGAASVRQLLTHSSGLPGWRPFYEQLSPSADLPASPAARAQAGQQMMQLIGEEALVHERGAKSLYSDLGFMLLGFIVERVYGASLDQVMAECIARPLSAESLRYRTSEISNTRSEGIAPTEYNGWRGRLLCGEVHDENAAALGGAAGHAGLFGTVESILAVTGTWRRAYDGRSSILTPDIARQFTRRQGDVLGSSWALGWDTPSTPSSSGRYFSPQSFGHLGYTGTSVWIDPDRHLEVVLLSNRVHPSRKNEAIRTFRPILHDLVYEEFVGRRH